MKGGLVAGAILAMALAVSPFVHSSDTPVDGGQEPRDSGVERSVLIGFDEHRSVCSFFGFTVHP